MSSVRPVSRPATGSGPCLVGLATQMDPIAGIEPRRLARELYGIDGEPVPLHGERNDNWRVTGTDGRAIVLKVSGTLENLNAIDLQIAALEHIGRHAPELVVPRLVRTRAGRAAVDLDGALAGHRVFAVSLVPGRPLESVEYGTSVLERVGGALARLDRVLRGFHHGWVPTDLAWDIRNAPVLRDAVSLVADAAQRRMLDGIFERFITRTLPAYGRLRCQFIHNDGDGANVLVTEDGTDVSGIVDFGDMTFGPLIVELAVPGADTARKRLDPLESIGALVEGYTATAPLERDEIAPLHDAILMRAATGLSAVVWRRRHDPAGAELLGDYDTHAWDFIERMLTHGPAKVEAQLARAARTAVVVPVTRPAAPATPGADADLIARRHRVLGKHLSLTYREPVHVVRGEGVWLTAADGRRYLDAYNNVPSVGHCHPHVVAALARQIATLNTNTRYLHETVVAYAERLAATMGNGLDACIFVNSGSEANDVAWRMAMAWTGQRGALVMENAYHGITEAVSYLSPYEVAEDALSPHVRTLSPPNTYRHPTTATDPGAHYAETADRAISALAAKGMKPALVMVDTGLTSNGIPEVVPGYLAGVAAKVRAAGGLYVADEVQFGVGRPGSHMWGFQVHGAVPDIVTMGKPIADGHPLGVVVARRDILEHFFAKTGFFSTFGGNPVSAAAGLATLEALEQDRLQENALTTGAYFKQGLAKLMERHERIGDVRGHGLLIGVDIVKDRHTKAPDKAETDRVKNRVRELGVLFGTEGAGGNILKIRPPLPFKPEHADIAVAALDQALAGR
ncbi:MAG: aminotransferase class III-fold pyridoxal phosphate-dependent enzyme [Alphaproteobacteria bacterium]|nr:aminotransferase class III-fold pyridoxal phosphate-dependent enzyme [Alphaproteobacteria bacterium]